MKQSCFKKHKLDGGLVELKTEGSKQASTLNLLPGMNGSPLSLSPWYQNENYTVSQYAKERRVLNPFHFRRMKLLFIYIDITRELQNIKRIPELGLS